MRVEANFQGDNQRVSSVEIILRCKNTDCEVDEKKNDEENKKEKQKDELKDKTNSEDDKENVIVTLIRLLKITNEKCHQNYDPLSDVISRSPMRNHDFSHGTAKPYEHPYSMSKVCGGVTRVVEADRTNIHTSLYRRLYTTLHSANTSLEGHVNDIDLCDINMWLNLCKKDPKLLSDFVQDCQSELSKKEISNFYEHRFSRNICSSVSSQFTSPAQSPSERSLTSPESLTCEENSLYYSRSPNIPSLDPLNIKVDDETKKKKAQSNIVEDNAYCLNRVQDLNILPNDTYSDPDQSPLTEAAPNIGTVMLNLAEDPYESTIDLNQFTAVCETHVESAPTVLLMPERDALNEKLDPKAKESAWARISQLDIDLLGKGDKEGDTQLMILLVSEKMTLEYVYVIVERFLRENPEYLSCRNELNQDALYLAAFKLVGEPLIASYIAEALVRGKQDVNKKYDGGNTILHLLAKRGDSHVRMLERLLKMNQNSQTPVFDVNKKNNKGFTPLHIACEAHKPNVLHTYQTVKVLVENGADCTAKDYKDENTPLHTLINESCNVEVLRIILESKSCENVKNDEVLSPTVVPNRQGNTALHLSCGRNTLSLQHQKDAIRLLLSHGAMIQLKNINGCVPSVLVDSTRKQEIKTILHGHRQKQL